MNIVFYSNVTTAKESYAQLPQLREHDVSFIRLSDKKELLKLKDTEILIVDAMGVADKEVISSMPRLRLILSEGVGYQGIDTEYAAMRGIPVCNNKGVNDTAVSELALFLMLGCLRGASSGSRAVYEGRQIDVKKASFGVQKEISECIVGLVGFGDIARCTAKYLNALGARVVYTNRTRYTELESEYNVQYMPLKELLAISDIVSLHLAVTHDTRKIVDEDFLKSMKKEAYLINTSRGELVDNNALKAALINNTISGAGLDVIAPEPVLADNILLDEEIKDKLFITPHIAGITRLTVKKIYLNLWDNISRLINNQQLRNKVN